MFTLQTPMGDRLGFEYRIRNEVESIRFLDEIPRIALPPMLTGGVIFLGDQKVHEFKYPEIDFYVTENGYTEIIVREMTKEELALAALKSQVTFLEMMVIDPDMGFELLSEGV